MKSKTVKRVSEVLGGISLFMGFSALLWIFREGPDFGSFAVLALSLLSFFFFVGIGSGKLRIKQDDYSGRFKYNGAGSRRRENSQRRKMAVRRVRQGQKVK